jgi:hypothetical protein
MQDKPVFIDARPAFEIVTLNARETTPNADGFGPVVPPYPSMWIEGEDLSYLADGLGPVKFAVHLMAGAETLHLDGKTDRRHNMRLFTMAPEGFTQEVPIRISFTVDAEGRLDQFMRGVDPADLDWFNSCDDDQRETITSVAKDGAIAALFTLSLMHSRNVTTAPATYVPERRRRSSRQRPAIEYHTIKLPAPKSSGGSGQITGTTKLHTARGHFKTYTADAPLMGKHVGTYYWGWQVRGKRTNGEIISSYEVGARVS